MGDIKLGIVCGLASERAVLMPTDRTLIGVSGAQPDKAKVEARRLIEEGATHLVSFGLAGALDPALASGDVVLPERVLHVSGDAWVSDARWRVNVAADLEHTALPLLGVESLVSDPSDKAMLRQRHGAVAVDMESHCVAKAAHEAGLPFLAVRAIADPATRALPKSIRDVIGLDGDVKLHAVFLGLLRHPDGILQLGTLKKESDAAHAALRQAGQRLLAAARDECP